MKSYPTFRVMGTVVFEYRSMGDCECEYCPGHEVVKEWKVDLYSNENDLDRLLEETENPYPHRKEWARWKEPPVILSLQDNQDQLMRMLGQPELSLCL